MATLWVLTIILVEVTQSVEYSKRQLDGGLPFVELNGFDVQNKEHVSQLKTVCRECSWVDL